MPAIFMQSLQDPDHAAAPPMPVLLPAQAYASFPLCMTCMCIACMHAYMNVCLLHEHHAWNIVSICVAWNHWRRCRRPRRQCSQRGTASHPRSIHMASMPLQQCHSVFPLPCLTPSSQRAAINAGIALEQQVVHPPNSNPLMGPQQPQHPPPQQLQQQQQQQPLLLPLQQPQQQQQQVRPFACITCKQFVCCGPRLSCHVCHACRCTCWLCPCRDMLMLASSSHGWTGSRREPAHPVGCSCCVSASSLEMLSLQTAWPSISTADTIAIRCELKTFPFTHTRFQIYS